MELDAAIEQSGRDAQYLREIGATIRALRQERGLSSLALTSLQKVATALGASVGSFFPEVDRARGAHVPHVVRASGGASQLSTGSQRTYRILSGRGFSRVLEPLLVTVEPSDTIEEAYTHAGEEFAYILAGELRFV